MRCLVIWCLMTGLAFAAEECISVSSGSWPPVERRLFEAMAYRLAWKVGGKREHEVRFDTTNNDAPVRQICVTDPPLNLMDTLTSQALKDEVWVVMKENGQQRLRDSGWNEAQILTLDAVTVEVGRQELESLGCTPEEIEGLKR